MTIGRKLKKYNLPDRMIAKLTVEGNCVVWTGYRLKQGYGRLSYEGKLWLAHRLAFFFAKGYIDPSKCILHKCDNPSCVNPNHLKQGTKQENTLDSVRKGRHVNNSGMANGRAILTPSKVKTIRKLEAKGIPRKQLAQRFNVSIATIQRVAAKTNWN